MYKSKLAIAIDSIIISIISFIAFFFLLRRIIKNAFFLTFVCILLSFCLYFIIFKLFLKKYNLNKISFKESKHMSSCIESLKFSSQKETNSFFENLLNCKFLKFNFFENDNFVYFIKLRTSLDSGDFFDALDFYFLKKKPIMIICESYDENFKKLVESKKDIFYIFSATDLYQLMKETKIFPTEMTVDKNFKSFFKDKISTFISTISKKHFKDYLFSGLSLIALSFFIPFSFYYSIFGIILLFLSVLCLLKNKTGSAINNSHNINLIDTIKK